MLVLSVVLLGGCNSGIMRRDFNGRNGSLNDNIGRCFSHHLEFLRLMMFRNRFLDISLIASQGS